MFLHTNTKYKNVIRLCVYLKKCALQHFAIFCFDTINSTHYFAYEGKHELLDILPIIILTLKSISNQVV